MKDIQLGGKTSRDKSQDNRTQQFQLVIGLFSLNGHEFEMKV